MDSLLSLNLAPMECRHMGPGQRLARQSKEEHAMSTRKPGMTVGSGQQIFGSDDISAAEKHQERQRADAAHKKGKALHDSIQKDPARAGKPSDDDYKNMSPTEKEAYKKGFRGQ